MTSRTTRRRPSSSSSAPATAASGSRRCSSSRRATELKSRTLSTLLLKLRDAPTPFAKVRQMIEDLVARLEAEAQAEQDQKTWCDENMKNTQDERDAAQNKIDGYNALHMEKSTLGDQLTEQMLTLSQEIADLNKALSEETELRAKEKATNEQVITDATTGKAAIEKATNEQVITDATT